MGRHWKFSCEDRVVSEVPKFGQGVIGQYPVLQPGNYDPALLYLMTYSNFAISILILLIIHNQVNILFI